MPTPSKAKLDPKLTEFRASKTTNIPINESIKNIDVSMENFLLAV